MPLLNGAGIAEGWLAYEDQGELNRCYMVLHNQQIICYNDSPQVEVTVQGDFSLL